MNILQAKSDHLDAGLVIALAGEDADYADDLAQNVAQAWLGVDLRYGAPLGIVLSSAAATKFALLPYDMVRRRATSSSVRPR